MGAPLVSHDWCVATGGTLTAEQRRLLLGRSLAAYSRHAVDLVRLALGRRSTTVVALPESPDDDLVEAALKAASAQGPDVEGHGLRTWLFGGALATLDGVELDPELLCVAGIAHDAGTASAVPGEDFTIRSARIAVQAFEDAGKPLDEARATALRDGIVAHLTAGVTVEDTAIGTYVQAGALLDLAGMRLIDLPASVVDEVFDRHPAGGVRDTIVRVIDAEARALPGGRFAQLRRLGFTLAIRTSPSLRGR